MIIIELDREQAIAKYKDEERELYEAFKELEDHANSGGYVEPVKIESLHSKVNFLTGTLKSLGYLYKELPNDKFGKMTEEQRQEVQNTKAEIALREALTKNLSREEYQEFLAYIRGKYELKKEDK